MRKYIPNAITLTRVALAPVIAFTFFLTIDTFNARLLALILMIIAELTDLFDGIAARKLGVVSDVGKILDPFSDSLYRFTIFASFMAIGYMPLWMLLIFFYRDSLASMLRILSALKGTAMSARMSGKIKAFVQAFAMFAVMLTDLIRFNPFVKITKEIDYEQIIFISLLIAAIYTLYSGVDYLIGSYKIWGKKSGKG